MGAIIRILGPIYSRVSPRKCKQRSCGVHQIVALMSFVDSIFFVSCDVVSLIVQGVGGGIAASSDDDRAAADLGGNIMLGGIVFQLGQLSSSIFCLAGCLPWLLQPSSLSTLASRSSSSGAIFVISLSRRNRRPTAVAKSP